MKERESKMDNKILTIVVVIIISIIGVIILTYNQNKRERENTGIQAGFYIEFPLEDILTLVAIIIIAIIDGLCVADYIFG